jgi:hypothetical protein
MAGQAICIGGGVICAYVESSKCVQASAWSSVATAVPSDPAEDPSPPHAFPAVGARK